MSLVDRVVASPDDWTPTRVIDEVAGAQYREGDRRRDPEVPSWLRDVLVLCDFDTHLQMEGLLGWWENAAAGDLQLVTEALRSVGMRADARLLEEAALVLDPGELATSSPQEVGTVSDFATRHTAVTPHQYERMREIETGLYLNEADGPDLYALLVAHASSGLASAAT